MATNNYDFQLTRNEIIETAFSKIGVLATGEVLAGEQLTQGAKALDLIVKELQNEHIFLWTEDFVTYPVTANQNYIELNPEKPIEFIREGYWKRQSTNYELQVTQLSKDVWYKEDSLYYKPDKTGEPDYFYFDTVQNKIFFTPIPNEDSFFSCVVVTRAKDWEVSSDKGEFPARWQLALIYLLAAMLADDYKIPLQERQLLASTARDYVDRAKSGDREKNDSLVLGGGFCVKRKTS